MRVVDTVALELPIQEWLAMLSLAVRKSSAAAIQALARAAIRGNTLTSFIQVCVCA